MQHAVFIPDLAPLDYYWLQSTANFLRLKRFNNQEEMEVSVKEFTASMYKNWYQRKLTEQLERWL